MDELEGEHSRQHMKWSLTHNSGKSTLFSALLKLLDSQSGTISIDGFDTSIIPRNLLRSAIIAIPQDPFILPGPMRFNLDPSGRSTDEVMISALAKSNLLAVTTSRGGLDAELTSSSLSQGEQRLFALAVALVRKWNKDNGVFNGGGILILDEATSGTDAETDGLIQTIIVEEFTGYTVLHISHRHGMMRGVDRVVELENGRIIN